MKVFAVIFTSFFLVGSADARADSTTSPAVVVTDKVSHASFKGSADTFTGSVQIEPLFPAKNPSRVSGGLVTFELGARSAWHTHPLGQTLIITSGGGWVQEWGGQNGEMKAGDVVSIPPGVKHWHGATASTGVSHIAIQETLDGKNVQWMEKVSDEQYSQ
jgi:quercetin dioxygenase-like cupin family protein